MKIKMYAMAILVVTIFSCKDSELTEVQLPEKEKKAETNYGNPDDVSAEEGAFQFPKLAYKYDEFENFVDGETMQLHYTKHFLGYTEKLNKLISENRTIQDKSIEEVLLLPKKEYQDVLNNAGGYYNHKLFFEILTSDKTTPSATLAKAIEKDFASVADFKKQFTELANKQFGSGWVWLVYNAKDKKLQLAATQNQDNTLMKDAEIKGTPIIGLDLWEHAYYLKYNSSRKDYINKFFDFVNWEVISKKFEKLNPVAEVAPANTTTPISTNTPTSNID